MIDNEILNHLSCIFFFLFVATELSSCANVLELTRTKQGPFTLEEHALPEDKWTIDDIAQSLERCSSLFPAELVPEPTTALSTSQCGSSTLHGLSRHCMQLMTAAEEPRASIHRQAFRVSNPEYLKCPVF